MVDWPSGNEEMARCVRSFDWSPTPLGPIDTWPLSLRTAVDLTLGSPVATILLWGPAHTQIYNGRWRELMGDKHPAALGQPAHACFPGIVGTMAPLYGRVRRGETVTLQNTLLPISRRGAVQSALWNVHCLPVRGEGAGVAGILCTVMETARSVVAERERTEAVAALRESEVVLAAQREALEAALNDAPLETSLGMLVSAVIDHYREGVRAAFYLANAQGEALHHIVGMPADYAAVVDGFVIGPDSLACGLATHTGEPVLTRDVREEPRWIPWRTMAEKFDYRGCWSFPIHSRKGEFVGTFALYWRQPREATPRDVNLAGLLVQSASIIIARDNEAVLRRSAEEALRESEERQAFLLRFGDALRTEADADRIGDRAIRMLAERMRLDRCYIMSMHVDENRAAITHRFQHAGMPPLPDVLRLSDFPAPLRQTFDRTVVIGDAGTEPGLSDRDKRSIEAIGQRAFIAPALRRGKNNPIRGLVAVSRTPRRWSVGEVALVEEVAERTWAAVERARAEAALHESEQRYRTMFRAMDEGYLLADVIFDQHGRAVDIQYVEANPAAERMIGAELAGRRLRDVSPDYEEYWYEIWGRVARSGMGERLERYASPEGLWYNFYVFKPDPDNHESRRVAALFQDATRRKQAEIALRESEERQRLMVELVPALLWWADPAGKDITVNYRWKSYTGQSDAEIQDFGWLDAFHPDDLDATRAAFGDAFATGEPLERQQRIRQSGGGYRWHLIRHVPIRGEGGAIIRWFGAAIDVHELHELQERQQVLVAELQHRTRNLLDVVAVLAERTIAAGSESLDDFETRYQLRLESLGRSQSLLSHDSEGIELGALLRLELAAHGADPEKDVRVEGVEVWLPSRMAQMLGLALHELMTNAMKYGALSSAGGDLSITWTTHGEDGRVRLRWEETLASPLTATPERRGFGRELIEEILPYDLDAETRLKIGIDGVRCTIVLPLCA